MNDTIDSCKCACHENKPPMNTDGLAHDNACCDEMNGQLEWCEVKRLIAKAVVEARIDGLLMAKYSIGQRLFLNKGNSDELVPVEIIGWRGGGVAPYEIKCLDGKSSWRYASARDMIAVCDDKQELVPPAKYLTTDEKLELLLSHLGLKIEVEPQVVKVVSDEKTSD